MMPGVLVSEALAQTAGLLLALSARTGNPLTPETPRFMVLAAVNIKFLRPAVPGECLSLHARFERTIGPLSHLAVSAYATRHEIANGTVVLAARKEST
jgi:3-hydroxymyristoyl/3-hydroxydecanoyl-(acyl carrier protein) dehydratase